MTAAISLPNDAPPTLRPTHLAGPASGKNGPYWIIRLEFSLPCSPQTGLCDRFADQLLLTHVFSYPRHPSAEMSGTLVATATRVRTPEIAGE